MTADINGLTNPFENSILNSNLTQLEKDKQIADYFVALSNGYEPPAEVLAEIASLLEAGVLSSDALARLQSLNDEIMAKISPVIDGGDTASITIDENSTIVTTVTADDRYSLNGDFSLTYSIVGGDDKALFQIDATTGALSFIAPPDYEAPVGGDNVYDVIVQVNDGATLMDTQTIQVAVADVNDTAPLPATFGVTLSQIQGSSSGWSVSSAGDVNGDGIDDILIGTRPRATNTREAYVVFGNKTLGTSESAASIDLSSLDGSNGFVFEGIDDVERGRYFSSAGDVNGDSIDDILIGTGGKTFVVFGNDAWGEDGSAPSIDLSTPLNGKNGFEITGSGTVFSASSAGDVNGDGVDDILIGRLGVSTVVFGKKTSLTGDFEASITLPSRTIAADPTKSIVFFGIDGTNDLSGYSVSSAGDVNGDGIDDILIGAHQADGPANNDGTDIFEATFSDVGKTYVVFGKKTSVTGEFAASIDLGTLNGANGFVLNGIDQRDLSGFSVSSAGDVNGDGIDDILIGAIESTFTDDIGKDTNGVESGEAYVVFGKKTSVTGDFAASIDLGKLNGDNGFVLNGIDADDLSGRSVSSAGDVNGDGINDILIGAPGGDTNGVDAGEAYLVFGNNTWGTGESAASIDLSSLNGTDGFVFKGIDANDRSGFFVSSAGDVNGDGVDDILIGAVGTASLDGSTFAGETYVVFGGADLLVAYDAADGARDGSIELSLIGENPLSVI
jgi:hypothetical protein